MEKIKLIHDSEGNTLTIWFDNPQNEAICEETADEVVLMKNKDGKVIGVEILNFKTKSDSSDFSVETVIHRYTA